MKQQCNSTHDQLCECAPGFHLVVEFCITHSTCSPGYGVTALGKTEINIMIIIVVIMYCTGKLPLFYRRYLIKKMISYFVGFVGFLSFR